MTDADVVFVSDCVATMAEGARPGPGFVAVRGNRVVATGTARDDAPVGPGTRVIDAGSRLVLPGLIDVHAHFEVAARVEHETVDCRSPRCTTVDEVLQTLGEHVPADGGWLVGQANLFFDRKLREGRLPTRAELDSVSTEVPIALRAGGHITVLNSKALEVVGIDRDYRAPGHSVTGMPIVERDAAGDAIGVVREFDNLLGLPSPVGETLETALRDGARTLFTRYGVTTVGEISETVEGLAAMEALHRRDDLGVRVNAYLWAPGTMSLEQACRWQEVLPEPADPERMRVQGVKLFADGGYSAASAYVKRPYRIGDCDHGTLALDPRQVATALASTRDAGLQLAIHANGDRAQEEVCAAIEAAGGAPGGALQTRIEHAGNFLPEHEETTSAWRRAGILPVPQPIFIYTFGGYLPDYLGDDYGGRGRFPFRTLLDEGWPITGSSDVWVGSEIGATNPFMSMWCSVERRSYTGETIDAEQALTLEEALRMHTLSAAQVLGQDDSKGSLEAGKLADVVVLDRNPFERPAGELPDTRADLVMLDGRLIYEGGP